MGQTIPADEAGALWVPLGLAPRVAARVDRQSSVEPTHATGSDSARLDVRLMTMVLLDAIVLVYLASPSSPRSR